MSDLEMVVAFVDQSHSFVHGYEAGAISEQMKALPDIIDCGFEDGFPVHTENVEVLRRIATHAGYAMEPKTTDMQEYTAVRFLRSSRPRPALSVVKGGIA